MEFSTGCKPDRQRQLPPTPLQRNTLRRPRSLESCLSYLTQRVGIRDPVSTSRSYREKSVYNCPIERRTKNKPTQKSFTTNFFDTSVIEDDPFREVSRLINSWTQD